MGKFARHLKVKITGDLDAKLKAAATRKQLSVATVVRDILEQALSEGAAVEGREALDKAIKRAMKPDVERLAKLIVKSTMAGAASMYLNVQAIADLGKNDAVELYQEARKKAVAYLREVEPSE